MSAISNFLTFLRSAIYAIDVRDGIADAIEQCYNDVNNPTLKTEALEAALQTKIDEGEMAALTIGDGTITAAKLASGVIDNTLATSGAAADAKKTGDEIAAVKADLEAQGDAINGLVPGLSNEDKVNLLECLRMMVWKEGAGSGPIYNLTDSLFRNKKDSRLIFDLDSPVALNGKTVNTGIAAPAYDEDFTFIVKALINKDSGNGNYFIACAGTLNDDTQAVLRLAVDFRNSLCEFVTNYLYADRYASWYTPSSIPSNASHEVTWVIRNNNKTLTKTLYVDGLRLLNKTESTTDYVRENGVNIILGANAPTQGSLPTLDGSIELARFYNAALSDTEIEQILVEFDNRIAFKIETPVNMVGKTINTGVNVPASNEDFTIIIKSTINAFETGEANRYVALWGNLNNDTQAVLRLAVETRNNVCEFVTNYLYADHYASWYAPHSISPSVGHELMWIIRNDNGSLRKVLYVDGNRILKRIESTSDYQRAQGGQIVLGISNQGVPTLNGTIDLARIYNVSLIDSEIERILNIDLS